MYPLGEFPKLRMRRMRRDDFSRRLMREHALTTDDLIYPLFVIEGKNRVEAVPSMPGVQRYTVDRLLTYAGSCLEAGIPAVALFPAIEPKLKTPDGREATNRRGLIPRAVAALKKRFPEIRWVSWREFGHIHGGKEREVLAALPQRFEELGIHAAICGMAC